MRLQPPSSLANALGHEIRHRAGNYGPRSATLSQLWPVFNASEQTHLIQRFGTYKAKARQLWYRQEARRRERPRTTLRYDHVQPDLPASGMSSSRPQAYRRILRVV